MGVVYRATDPNIDRTLALKTMRLDVHGVGEDEILKRFKQEAKLAGVMNHTNIVTIYDAGEDEGLFYIAMEFIEGKTLQSMLYEEHVLHADRIVEISRGVCTALDYAHQRNVIHRDIKPANIMMANSGLVKIMDFGIAKSGTNMTSAGQVLGTPTYMSPEQVRGRQLDGRSDLFSYGVVLYEMLTGEKPFNGQNVTTIIYKIMNEAPIPPRELDSAIHPGLSSVISKMLVKNPDERYQTGKDLLYDLENYKSIGAEGVATRVMSAAAATSVMPSSTTAMPKPPVQPIKIQSDPHSPTVSSVRPQIPTPFSVNIGVKPITLPGSQTTGETVHGGPEKVYSSGGSFFSGFDKRKAGIYAGVAVAILIAGSIIPIKQYFDTKEAARLTQEQKQQQEEAEAAMRRAGIEPNLQSTNPAGTSTTAVPKAGKGKRGAAGNPDSDTPSGPLVQTADLRVSSNPPGAIVTIGGATQKDWVTPFTADKIPAGTYDVIFGKPGYKSENRSVNVIAGKPVSISADLTTAGARIMVSSNPDSASIWLEGKNTGRVTPVELQVEKGEHQIEVRKQGYQEAAVETNLNDGETYKFDPILQAEKPGSDKVFAGLRGLQGGGGSNSMPDGMGMMVIKSNPPGAHIFHGGKVSPKTTPVTWPIKPGTYQITIRMEGYKPAHRQFTVEQGKVTNVDVMLEPQRR